MHSEEYRKYLVEQLRDQKKFEKRFEKAFHKASLASNEGAKQTFIDNAPSINVTQSGQNALTDMATTNAQLIELLYPFIKDYNTIDLVLADPELTIELKKALIYNFVTSVEPKLSNLKTKKININEFQKFLKSIAQDILSSETVFKQNDDTLKKAKYNKIADTDPEKTKYVQDLIKELVANNKQLISQDANLPDSIPLGNARNITKPQVIQYIIKLGRIDRSVITYKLVDQTLNKPSAVFTDDYLDIGFRNHLQGLTADPLKQIYNDYINELQTYDLTKQEDPLQIYDSLRKVFKAREKDIVIYGSGISNKHSIRNKYYIEKNKLDKNILEIRYLKNKHLVPIKSQLISAKLRDIIKQYMQNGTIEKKEAHDLIPKEKHLLQALLPYFGLALESIDEADDEYAERFEVLKGSILAGNTNPAVKKEARQYLLHAYKTGLINHKQYVSMIEDLDL